MPLKTQWKPENIMYSLRNYDQSNDFMHFGKSFEKWAAIEVEEGENIPAGLERIFFAGGIYARFHFKGPSHDATPFQFIYGEWLPASGFIADHRLHFELLGNSYVPNHKDAEEDIFIPVKSK